MQTVLPFLFIGGAIVVILIIGYFAHKAEQKRKELIRSRLESLGFRVNIGTPPIGFERIFANIPSLRGGGTNVVWSASATPTNDLPMWILEHRYSTGSGKNRQTHYHTVAATHCPLDWWRFTMTAENFFHRIGDSWGLSKDVNLEDPVFNKRWRVKCDDDSTALAVLTPQVQAVLANAPSHEWWVIGRGVLACVWSRHFSESELESILQRLATLIDALSPEVRAMIEETRSAPEETSVDLEDVGGS